MIEVFLFVSVSYVSTANQGFLTFQGCSTFRIWAVDESCIFGGGGGGTRLPRVWLSWDQLSRCQNYPHFKILAAHGRDFRNIPLIFLYAYRLHRQRPGSSGSLQPHGHQRRQLRVLGRGPGGRGDLHRVWPHRTSVVPAAIPVITVGHPPGARIPR